MRNIQIKTEYLLKSDNSVFFYDYHVGEFQMDLQPHLLMHLLVQINSYT